MSGVELGIAGWCRRSLKWIVLMVVCAASVGYGNRGFWEGYASSPEYQDVWAFQEALHLVPLKSRVLDDALVRKADTLCQGAQRLLAGGNQAGARQIIEANGAVLGQALTILRHFHRCEQIGLTAGQVAVAIQEAKAAELYAVALGGIQAAISLKEQGEYEKAIRAYEGALERAGQRVGDELSRLRKALDQMDGAELRLFGGSEGEGLEALYEKGRDELNKGEVSRAIRRAAILSRNLQVASNAVAAKREEIRAEVGRRQAYREVISYLDGVSAETGPLAFVEALRGEVRANRRFQAGHQVINSVGMKLVYLPAGTYERGSLSNEAGRDDNETLHRVTLSRGFFIGVFEVTHGQWAAVMGSSSGSPMFPKDNVSWNEAVAFCKKLSAMEGARHYRLPTEAEWEYACRAGKSTPFNTGKAALSGQDAVIYNTDFAPQSPAGVGMFAANGWGLYDMHGNVAEWCSDWLGAYPSGAVVDPTGPADHEIDREFCGKVIRGGSWVDDASGARSASRQSQLPVIASDTVGFRVVLDAATVDF
jgi:formylglycine-generating enzyme required for sulfatase activity